MAYEWDPRPPTTRERAICAVWLVAFVLAAGSYYGSWRMFGDYDKWMFGGLLFLTGALLMVYNLIQTVRGKISTSEQTIVMPAAVAVAGE